MLTTHSWWPVVIHSSPTKVDSISVQERFERVVEGWGEGGEKAPLLLPLGGPYLLRPQWPGHSMPCPPQQPPAHWIWTHVCRGPPTPGRSCSEMRGQPRSGRELPKPHTCPLHLCVGHRVPTIMEPYSLAGVDLPECLRHYNGGPEQASSKVECASTRACDTCHALPAIPPLRLG